ncbi:MAG: hypothetical protein OXL96_14240 [Candidatus Poribacteria bacterium]|nr:hypothetical protein [Candidatus Poribacteria bacterium]
MTISEAAVRAHADLRNAERLREIYEATLLAHITLVGQSREYVSGSVVDSEIETYRRDILHDQEYEGPSDRWRLVRDVTFERFRNGTMEVYIPFDNDVEPAEYIAICPLARDEGARTVVVRHPSFTREYRKTTCMLGTAFQDQAYFLVRRDNSGYPDLLERPLTVFLACGYDQRPPHVKDRPCPGAGSARECTFTETTETEGAPGTYSCEADLYDAIAQAKFSLDDPVDRVPSCTVAFSDPESFTYDTEARYRFEPIFENPQIYPVPLYSNQDVVRFSVPRLSEPFDASPGEEDELHGRFEQVRCSIMGAVYGIHPIPPGDSYGRITLPTYDSTIIDNNMLTATVTVSKHPEGRTLHTHMNDMLQITSDERVEKMKAAMYYTYFLGWYTGFIRMPYFSLQDMLSALPYTVVGDDEKTAALSTNQSVLRAVSNNERLRRYRLLSSLLLMKAMIVLILSISVF